MSQALWFWSMLPIRGDYIIPIYCPPQYSRECEPPIPENRHTLNPWDLNYDPRRDPVMVIASENKKIVERSNHERYGAKAYDAYNHATKSWLDGILSDTEYLHRCENIGDETTGRYFGKLAATRINRLLIKIARQSASESGKKRR